MFITQQYIFFINTNSYLDAPERITLVPNSTLAVEGINGLKLMCTVPDGQHGNPDIYSYFWMYPATTLWINSTQDSITIESFAINATKHDGQWQCKVGNLAGNTTVQKINITINGELLM